MPNAKTHILVGAMASMGTALLDKKKHPISHHIAIAPVTGALMGKLPDVIEPAFHPNHRNFFHSVAVMTLISSGLLRAYKWSPEEPLEKFVRGFILIGGVAYLSHLVCDATTAKGLPLVGKI